MNVYHRVKAEWLFIFIAPLEAGTRWAHSRPHIYVSAKRSNQSILNEISPEYSLEGLTLKLKLQYFGHLMRRTDSFVKDPDVGKD